MQTAARMQPLKNGHALGRPRPFRFLGGRLAVDFANTVGIPLGDSFALSDWQGFVAFLEQAGVISSSRSDELLRLAQADRQAADDLLDRALALRSALRRAFETMTAGGHAERGDVEAINELLRVTEGHDELVSAGREWKLQLIAREQRPEWLLAAIARSAAELVAEGAGAPLRRCANPACPLFFYDTSRTGKRRWCSMATCGNRSKVAAFSRRSRRARNP